MREFWKHCVRGAAALAFLLASGSAMAWPCDFTTGGGFIFFHGNKANFGVGGGCKHGTPTWGHLEYVDHGIGLNVHWTSITGYFDWGTATGSNGKLVGTRLICGTADTNLFGPVYFAVRASDNGEPGVNDQFDMRLRTAPGVPPVYDTTSECEFHYLGSKAPCSPGSGGGGNIQLHKPNPSTTGNFGGSCPAL